MPLSNLMNVCPPAPVDTMSFEVKVKVLRSMRGKTKAQFMCTLLLKYSRCDDSAYDIPALDCNTGY